MAEVTAAELEPADEDGSYSRLLSLQAAGPWPLLEAQPGQRFRIHLGPDLIGVATVREQRNGTTIVHAEPSRTGDPATAHLIEKVQTGDRLIVSGPFGRG